MCSMGPAGCRAPARGLAIRRAVPARAPARVRSKCRSSHFEPQVAVILGMQWGDEGKGKLVDVLAKQYDIVARAQGGANAGHTIYDDEGKQYKLHLVPSGILNRSTLCVIGNGVVIHLPSLMAELEDLQAKGVTSVMDRIVISERAHLLFDLHKDIDAKREEESKGRKIGTTKRGIGPAYASKATRNGLRVCDLKNADIFQEKLDRLVEDTKARWGDMSVDTNAQLAQYAVLAKDILPMMCDTVDLLNTAFEEGKRVLVEGANATMLDLDFGTYPYVTSSNPSIGGVVTGLGLAPNKFGAIIGVAKAYSTRVGEGPYPTEVFGQLAEDLRDKGAEFGTTTGRPRRIGWLDMVALKYACRINGLTHINLTKLDVLSDLDEIPIGIGYKLGNGKTIVATFPADLGEVQDLDVEYEGLPGWKSDISNVRSWDELPEAAQMYCQRVEDLTGVHVKWIGVGPGRDALIEKPSAL